MTSWWLIMTQLWSKFWRKMGGKYRKSALTLSAPWRPFNFFSEYCSELNSASDKAKKSGVAPCGGLHNWGQRLKTFKTSVQIRNFKKISRYSFFVARDAPIPVIKLEYSLTMENLVFLWCPSLIQYNILCTDYIFFKFLGVIGRRKKNVDCRK